MVVGHLLCGMMLGWLAAVSAFLVGLPVHEALAVYCLGACVGFAASILTIVSRPAGSSSE